MFLFVFVVFVCSLMCFFCLFFWGVVFCGEGVKDILSFFFRWCCFCGVASFCVFFFFLFVCLFLFFPFF